MCLPPSFSDRSRPKIVLIGGHGDAQLLIGLYDPTTGVAGVERAIAEHAIAIHTVCAAVAHEQLLLIAQQAVLLARADTTRPCLLAGPDTSRLVHALLCALPPLWEQEFVVMWGVPDRFFFTPVELLQFIGDMPAVG